MIESVAHAFTNLWRRKGRTALTILSVVVGVMLVSIVSVIGDAGERLFYDELTKMGVDGFSVTIESGSIPMSALDSIREIESVRSAMPLTVGTGAVTVHSLTEETMLCGIDAGADQAVSLELLYGRLISDGDVRAHDRVCLIEETYAKTHFGRTNVIGRTVLLTMGGKSDEYTVIGVATAGSSLLQGMMDYIPTMVFVPYTTWQDICYRQELSQIAVRVQEGTDDDALRDTILKVLSRQGSGNEKWRVENLAAQKDRMETLLQVVLWILTIISGVSLVVSGLGIMTIMLVSVQERVREIGIKKAVGAGNSRILWEFMLESGLLAAIGGGIGLLVGGAISCVGVYVFTGMITIPWSAFFGVWLFTVVIGVLGGIAPAIRAAKMPPVEALCSE
ncbi:MAG: FtsX-like permease family protein [Ruminococcaceae bacterium]|nr:FtsX-like permease family protein [Oscillospiraceae bacterium]